MPKKSKKKNSSPKKAAVAPKERDSCTDSKPQKNADFVTNECEAIVEDRSPKKTGAYSGECKMAEQNPSVKCDDIPIDHQVFEKSPDKISVAKKTSEAVDSNTRKKSVASSSEHPLGAGSAALYDNASTSDAICVYKYASSMPLYLSSWSPRPAEDSRIAVISFVERAGNRVFFLKTDPELHQLVEKGYVSFKYPQTCVQWIPDSEGQFRDLIALSGDFLRVMAVNEDEAGAVRELKLHHEPKKFLEAPLTSLDWCRSDPSIIATSCVDGTCILWNIDNHRRIDATEPAVHLRWWTRNVCVYDVSFSQMGNGRNVFATACSDGTVRMYDARRARKHSKVLFEAYARSPFLRVRCNRMNDYFVATFSDKSNSLLILDARKPGKPYTRINCDDDALAGIVWKPDSPNQLNSIAHLHTYHNDVQSPNQINRISEVPERLTSISCSDANPCRLALCYNKILEVIEY